MRLSLACKEGRRACAVPGDLGVRFAFPGGDDPKEAIFAEKHRKSMGKLNILLMVQKSQGHSIVSWVNFKVPSSFLAVSPDPPQTRGDQHWRTRTATWALQTPTVQRVPGGYVWEP